MTPKRYDAVDFWRGIALVTIFVNHMPGNVLEIATPRNFGFSDSAEAFVFMAGFAGALAYGGKFERGESVKALGSIARRVGVIYVVQVFMTFLAMALYAAAYKWGGAWDILSIHDRSIFVQQPLESIMGTFLLGTQIGYYNILPMYVVFLAAVPLLLLIANRSIVALCTLSFAVYAVARFYGINIPTFPTAGDWFFNPLAWQLVYCLGLAAGTFMRQGKTIPLVGPVYSLSLTFTVASAIIVSNGLGLLPGLFARVAVYLDLSKTDLGMVRLIDFLTLAYVVYVSGVSRVLRTTPIFQPLSLMGRNSIWVFAAGSILATGGQILMEVMKNTVVLDVTYAAFGVFILYLVAAIAQGARSKPAQTPVPSAVPTLKR